MCYLLFAETKNYSNKKMEMAAARSQRGKGKRYQDRDYGKTIKQLDTTRLPLLVSFNTWFLCLVLPYSIVILQQT
jgi:hypothetical protein